MSRECEQGTCDDMVEMRDRVASLETEVRILKETRALAWKWGAAIGSALVLLLELLQFVWEVIS